MSDWTAVADDLTGAMDLASALGAPRAPAWVAADERALRGLDGPRVLDAATRFLSPRAAFAAVGAAWRRLGGTGRCYQKIDSTLRGNPREEIEAFLAASCAPWMAVLPAYPALGRATRGGVLWVKGRRLDHSEYARDPLTPARAPGPKALLRGLPAVHAGGALLRQGQAGLRRWIRAQRRRGSRLFSFDCRDEGDLGLIARTLLSEHCRHFAGASGLARALVPPKALTALPRLPWLFLAGSLSGTSFEQLGALGPDWAPMRSRRAGRWAVLGPGSVRSLTGRLKRRRRLALSSLGARSELLPWLRHQGARSAQERRTAAERSLDGLAALAAQILHRVPAGCLATGGHTLSRLFAELGVQRVAVLGQALPGVALGKAQRGDGSWSWIASKPGGFGGADLFARFMERTA